MSIEERLDGAIRRNKMSMRLFATGMMFFGVGCVRLGVDRDLLVLILGIMYVIAVLR